MTSRCMLGVAMLIATACRMEMGDEDDDSEAPSAIHAQEPSAVADDDPCPESEMYLADTCEEEGASCRFVYDDMYMCMTRTFHCAVGKWWLVVDGCDTGDCPKGKPTDRTSCGSEAAQCRYPGHYCPWFAAVAECKNGQWSVAEPECGNEPWNGGIGVPQ